MKINFKLFKHLTIDFKFNGFNSIYWKEFPVFLFGFGQCFEWQIGKYYGYVPLWDTLMKNPKYWVRSTFKIRIQEGM